MSVITTGIRGECGCCDDECHCCDNYTNEFESGYYAVWTLVIDGDMFFPPIPDATYTMTKREGECVWESEDGKFRIFELNGPGMGGGTQYAGYSILVYDDAEDADEDYVDELWADAPTFGLDDQWCREEGNDNPMTELDTGVVSLTPDPDTWVSCFYVAP